MSCFYYRLLDVVAINNTIDQLSIKRAITIIRNDIAFAHLYLTNNKATGLSVSVSIISADSNCVIRAGFRCSKFYINPYKLVRRKSRNIFLFIAANLYESTAFFK